MAVVVRLLVSTPRKNCLMTELSRPTLVSTIFRENLHSAIIGLCSTIMCRAKILNDAKYQFSQKFSSALQSLFPYYGHVIRSMEITAPVFHRTLWNLAWLCIGSIFRAEVRLRLIIIIGTKFKPNFQKLCRGIVGNLWHINSEFPGR